MSKKEARKLAHQVVFGLLMAASDMGELEPDEDLSDTDREAYDEELEKIMRRV